MGGALAVPGEPAGALAHVGAEYVVFTFGVAAAPELVEPIRASLRAVAAACGPSATARIPLTFLGPDSDLSAVHDHETLSRLRAVKRMSTPTTSSAATTRWAEAATPQGATDSRGCGAATRG